MKKSEVKTLVNKIKGYYNNQFFIDDYVMEAWAEEMKPYDLEDAVEHIYSYLREYPDIAPKPHTFSKGLLTPEEKTKYKNSDFTVACQLCGRWMPLEDYDEHYNKCLDIEYLVNVAKQKGNDTTRTDLEELPQISIDKLLKKYAPKKVEL